MKPRSRQQKEKRRRTERVKPEPENADLLVLTIGHSTRPIGEFVALLRAHGVTTLVDVRTVPRSRHNPQFGQEQLPASLEAAGIAYQHEVALGGLRRTSEQSPNKGWRNSSFRGYADHMQTQAFQDAVERLITQTSGGQRLALMCAEAVPWRCHRSLIADALLVRGVKCEDIRTPTQRMPHRITTFARVRGTAITYPGDGGSPPTEPRRRAKGKKLSADVGDAPTSRRKKAERSRSLE